ncbi:hypothetical protein ACH4GZ_38635 [Streptomyces hygroscopicus]|uniref:hypothetical protein n=1 Tax=Streptomyces hygroscopicus TaxID=1912 RepID=UPI0037B8AFF0
MTADLDRSRRYLKPVPRLALLGEPNETHLALYGWEDRLGEWVTSSPAICGRSAEQGDLPMDAEVTCPACIRRRPQYESVLARENDVPPVAARVAARRDPRYPAVRDTIRCYGWNDGSPMVPDGDADLLATRVMAAVRARETAQQPSCGECGHPQDQHTEADDPTSVGQCRQCAAEPDGEDDSWHDYEPKGA